MHMCPHGILTYGRLAKIIAKMEPDQLEREVCFGTTGSDGHAVIKTFEKVLVSNETDSEFIEPGHPILVVGRPIREY